MLVAVRSASGAQWAGWADPLLIFVGCGVSSPRALILTGLGAWTPCPVIPAPSITGRGGPVISAAPRDVGDDLVVRYASAMCAAGRTMGRSSTQTARTFMAKIQRAQGFSELGEPEQVDAINKARSFASW